jgi:membrane-associated phospholipid phosphatase
VIEQLTTVIYGVINKYAGNAHILCTHIDSIIPFEKVFIVPYLSWPFYFMSALIYLAIFDAGNYFRLLISSVSGKVVCFVIYLSYTTTVPRPEVVGNDFFAHLVRTTYGNDRPYNCFPSIHVLCALLTCMFLFKHSKRISVRIYATTFCVLISLSTMFVKQHYSPDVIAGLVLGGALYALVTNESLQNKQWVGYIKAILMPARLKNDYINFR